MNASDETPAVSPTPPQPQPTQAQPQPEKPPFATSDVVFGFGFLWRRSEES